MTDASSAAFSDSPDASSAADALRAAAEGNPPKGPASRTEKQALALKEAASQKAGKFREFAGEKTEDFKETATEKIGAFREGAGQTAGQIRDVASEQWEETRVRAKQLHLSMEDYIRENPTKSVLSALGVGLVVGLIIRR